MNYASRLFCGLLLGFVWLLPAKADEFRSSVGDGRMSAACRAGLDGITTCVRIRGYVWAGDGLPARSPGPIGGAFAPARLGFSETRLGAEPQPNAPLGQVRVYIDNGANWNR